MCLRPILVTCLQGYFSLEHFVTEELFLQEGVIVEYAKGGVEMIGFLKTFHRKESGQDLIEYALIGLIVALGAIAGMGTLASSINAEFTKMANKLT